MKTLAFHGGGSPASGWEDLAIILRAQCLRRLAGFLSKNAKQVALVRRAEARPTLTPYLRRLAVFLSKGAEQAAPVRRAEARPTLTLYLRRLAVFLSGMRNTDRVCPMAGSFCLRAQAVSPFSSPLIW